MPKIKFAFFGTPDLVIPILDELEKHSLLPSLIVTGMDVPKGRNLVITPPPPKLWAEKRDIEVWQPEKIDKDFIEKFKQNTPTGGFDLGVVVAYGKILPEVLLSLPKHGMFNVHYSLLPKYRGATPVESAILNGEEETGVCIQKMAYELDAGDVIAEAKTEIKENEKTPELRARLNEMAKQMLPKAIVDVVSGKAHHKKQDDTLATHSKKIKKEDGLLDLSADPISNWRKFKAYYGSVGTYFFTEKNGKQIRVKITDAEFKDGKFQILKVIPESKKEIPYSLL